jgi:hypothetical protein
MASSWNTGTLVEQADSAVDVAIASASRAVQEGKSLFQSVVDEAADKLAQGAEAISEVPEIVGEAVSDVEIVSPELREALQARPRPTGISEVNIPDPLGAIQQGALNLGQTAKTLWNLGTSTPAKLLKEDILLFDFVKENSVINESSFDDDEIEFLKELARKKGTGRVTKADYGSLRDTSVRGAAEADVLTTGSLSAADRVYNSLSEFMIRKDPETGEYFAEDTYDWNLYVDYNDPAGGIDKKTGRPRGVVYTTEEFEEKFNPMEELFNTINSDASEFEKAHNLAFLLGSRDYVDNSKDTGRKVRINLGKLD